MSATAGPVRALLLDAARLLRRVDLAHAAAAWGVRLLVFLLVAAWLDNLLALPSAARLPIALGGAAWLIVDFVRRVARPLLRASGPDAAAVRLERLAGVEDNLWINAGQLEGANLRPVERAIAARAAMVGLHALRAFPRATLWQPRLLRRRLAILAVCGVAALAYAALLPRHAWNAALRYAMPLREIAPAAGLRVTVAPAGTVVLAEGDDLHVQLLVAAPDGSALRDAPQPLLIWREGDGDLPPRAEGARQVAPSEAGAGGRYAHTFADVRIPFTFRALAGGGWSAPVQVRVQPLPRLRAGWFRVFAPAYTGLSVEERPGPPAPLVALPGARAEVRVQVEGAIASLVWSNAQRVVEFVEDPAGWTARVPVEEGGAYALLARARRPARTVALARGEVRLQGDAVPRVAFVADALHRLVQPGETVIVRVEAADDLGLREVQVTARDEAAAAVGTAGTATGEVLRTWSYVGPPGRATATESLSFSVDPTRHPPGSAIVIEAAARDFNPLGEVGRARPLVLRVRGWDEWRAAAGALGEALEALRKAIEAQRTALSATRTLDLYRTDAMVAGRVGAHRDGMATRQTQARSAGDAALGKFRGLGEEGATFVRGMEPLLQWEMPWVLDAIRRLPVAASEAARPAAANLRDGAGRADAALVRAVDGAFADDTRAAWESALGDRLRAIGARQEDILRRLQALLAQVAGAAQPKDTALAESAPPVLTAEQAAREAKEALASFAAEQKKIVERTRALEHRKPDDLTQAEEEILGDLARDEAELARFLQEKLTDFSKLPLQDFADGSLAEEFNEVFQEVKGAADSLYKKNIELAVPQELSGLEKAEEILHNLERWLPAEKDRIQWSMEEPPAPSAIPLAELPAELEDIVGDLLDKEEEMSDEIEDISSSWLDSLDKGAGWDAMDGPISSMSAKGVTGNLLPNEMEIGGRSGEGRGGRSSGQMVEESAEGKDGRETPTRLSPSPFEPGSVEDAKGESGGGATGGGKLSGFDAPGLRGPNPVPPRLDIAARLSDAQARIRQEAEQLSLHLRRMHLPSGDLESAAIGMRRVEAALRGGDGLALRRAYSGTLDALGEARRTAKAIGGLQREIASLPPWMRDEILQGAREGVPEGYEELVPAYFRRLASGELEVP